MCAKTGTGAGCAFLSLPNPEHLYRNPLTPRAAQSILDRTETTGVRPMVEIAELTSNDTLRLPARVAALFRPADRFMVWIEGDTLYLKRIMPRSVTTIVEKGPQDEPLSLDEINDIVHEVRRRRRAE